MVLQDSRQNFQQAAAFSRYFFCLAAAWWREATSSMNLRSRRSWRSGGPFGPFPSASRAPCAFSRPRSGRCASGSLCARRRHALLLHVDVALKPRQVRSIQLDRRRAETLPLRALQLLRAPAPRAPLVPQRGLLDRQRAPRLRKLFLIDFLGIAARGKDGFKPELNMVAGQRVQGSRAKGRVKKVIYSFTNTFHEASDFKAINGQ